MKLPQSARRPLAALTAVAAAAFALPAAGQTLAPQTLAEAEALLRQAAAALAPAGARIEVVAGALDSRLRLAPCDRIQAYLPPASRAWGRTRAGLRCLQGASAWNVFLPMTVRVFAPALVAAAPLPAGVALEDGHLREGEVDWAAETAPVLTRPQAAVGRTLARALGAGQALRSSDLRSRQWFAAGDTVHIVATGSGFSVSGEGLALSNGIEGQAARVRTEGGRVVSGQPSGERRIEVPL